MFYIFNGCGAVCTGCCRGCDAIGKACAAGCGAITHGCDAACHRAVHGIGSVCGACGFAAESACDCVFHTARNVCGCITSPLRRPLGGYVVLSAVLNIVLIKDTFEKLKVSHAEDCDSIHEILIVETVLAVFHILFSLYVQHMLAVGLVRDDPTVYPNLERRKSLARRAWHLLLYDVGFCLYMPTFLFSFCSGCYGMYASAQCGGNSDQGVFFPSVLLVMHTFFALAYMIVWSCIVATCGCCSALVEPSARAPLHGANPSGATQY